MSFEDRQDLLGHRSGRITTHYSAADLSRLIEAADSVCERDGRRPELVVLRSALQGESRKTPANQAMILEDARLGHALDFALLTTSNGAQMRTARGQERGLPT